jgi:hypothetical protein
MDQQRLLFGSCVLLDQMVLEASLLGPESASQRCCEDSVDAVDCYSSRGGGGNKCRGECHLLTCRGDLVHPEVQEKEMAGFLRIHDGSGGSCSALVVCASTTK